MAGLWGYLGGTVIRPKLTFDRLRNDPRQIALGFKAMLFIGILYTATVAAFAVAGALPAATPFLRIAEPNYYFYEIFFALPVFLAGWVLAAGFAVLAAGKGRDGGTFEDTLAAFGFAIAIPSLVTWLPETIFAGYLLSGGSQVEFMDRAAEPGFWQAFVWGYQIAFFVWMTALVAIALAASRRVRRPRAVLAAILTAVVFMAFEIVFIR
jgi:hypothetical protein